MNSLSGFLRQRLSVQWWFMLSARLLLTLGICRDITRRSLRVHEQRWSSEPEAPGTLYQDPSIDDRRASSDGVSQTARTGGNCLSPTRGLTLFLCSHVISVHVCTDRYSFGNQRMLVSNTSPSMALNVGQRAVISSNPTGAHRYVITPASLPHSQR